MHTDPFDEPRYTGCGKNPRKRKANALLTAGLAASFAAMPFAPEHIDPPFKSVRKKKPSNKRAKVKAARRQNKKRRAGR